jgi:hypothetical protein
MAIATESLTLHGLQSAALVIVAEFLALSGLQSAAYPIAVTITPALDRSATVAANVASATVAGNALRGQEPCQSK